MGRQTVVTEQELADRTGVEPSTIGRWLETGLLQHDGKSKSGTHFVPELMVERVAHIQRLLELGYREEEVGRILRKVGIPSSSDRSTRAVAPDNLLTVGALAESVGVSSRTIKHWEDKGIIEADARSDGGFRLFQEHYVYLCKLIQDLQLFGYSLDQIKQVSDYFRDFLSMREDISRFEPSQAARELDQMVKEIDQLFGRTGKLREGIERWEKLLNKQKRQITELRRANAKRVAEDRS